MMNEIETPLIRIAGTITEKDYVNANRSIGARSFFRISAIFLGAELLFNLAIGILEYSSYIQAGLLTFGEALKYTWEAFFQSPVAWIIIAAVMAFDLLFLLLIRPALTGKSVRELYPDGAPVIYDFFEDRLVICFQTKTIDETVRVSYADVLRKIIETKYQFILQTNQRNRIFVFKTIMTPEEMQNVRELLKSRCPQRRNSKPKA